LPPGVKVKLVGLQDPATYDTDATVPDEYGASAERAIVPVNPLTDVTVIVEEPGVPVPTGPIVDGLAAMFTVREPLELVTLQALRGCSSHPEKLWSGSLTCPSSQKANPCTST
jgi:hypothetical protein